MHRLSIIALLACAACSSSGGTVPDDAGPLPSDATEAPQPDASPAVPDLATTAGGDAGDTAHSATLSMPAVALGAGMETTQCVELPLDNAAPALIRHIHVTLAPGSHHLIVYRSTTAKPQPTPAACGPFQGIQGGTVPLFIAQATDSDLVMPAAVGIQIAAHQMIRIEEHFLNATTKPIQGTGSATLDLVPGNGGVTPADLMFWGTTAIQIPPHSTGTAGMYHVVKAGVHVFGITAHEHHLGTLTTVSRATGVNDPGAEIYHSTNWAEPPLQQYDPPLAFNGSDGLRLHCEYDNTTDMTVGFGESAAKNEMCFFWAYYYPSHGFDPIF